MRSQRRSNVSAITPPTYANNTSGSISAVWTSETRIEACGWLTSSHWAPTVCIQVPMLLASTASHRLRNTVLRKGAQGDSGTSSRVFSMIAGQMGDTRYRGKLIWLLLTSRPDLLPIDLKRQGRAEVHLPLFAPRGDAEVRHMIEVMARSGADLESLVLSAKRRALTEGRETLARSDLEQALDDFIPSAQGLEKEKQELAAVLECTSMSFLADDWRSRVAVPDGRAKLQERMATIRRLIED